MSTDEARAEAERITMYSEDRGRSEWLFVAGAEWQATRPFTEEDVEAAAVALCSGDFWEYPHTDLDRERYRKRARAALDAVTKRRQT